MRVVSAVVAAAAAALIATSAQAQTPVPQLAPGETLLEIEATGVDTGRPDLVTLYAGVSTQGSTAAEASRENAAVAQRILGVLRAQGVEARDMTTRDLRVEPLYADQNERTELPRLLGYRAENRVEVRLRDVATAPRTIDALIAAGANRVNGPIFSVSDRQPAIRAAEQDAVRRARQQAETYAASLGLRVVRIVSISERGGFDPEIVVTGTLFRTGASIEQGETDTRVKIWAAFALAPR